LLLGSLDEGIVLVKKGEISFLNKITEEIFERLKRRSITKDMNSLDVPIFKIFRKNDSSEDSHNFSRDIKDRQYTIRQLLNTTQDFLKDKIF